MMAFFRKLLQNGDLCFDIGANVGQTAEIFSLCGANVIAVEPNRLCHAALRWQFQGSRRVVLVDYAIGPREGSCPLFFSGTESTASMRADWPYGNTQTQIVTVITLDRLIKIYGCPDLCKVDVEGFEYEVFEGLSAPIPIVIFEFRKPEIEIAMQILDRLSSIGNVISINIADLGFISWLFDRWISPSLFSKLEGDAIPDIGNIVVRSKI